MTQALKELMENLPGVKSGEYFFMANPNEVEEVKNELVKAGLIWLKSNVFGNETIEEGGIMLIDVRTPIIDFKMMEER